MGPPEQVTPEKLGDYLEVLSKAAFEATVHNAQAMLDLDREHEGFGRYLRSLPDYEALVADLHGRFKFLGDTGAYFFLYVIGEPVPPHKEWMAAHPPRAPRRQAARPPRSSREDAPRGDASVCANA
jgi:3-methyladenine DNA glycosylase Tag